MNFSNTLLGESLWRDEAYSWTLAKHNLFDIVQTTINDTMPPLYHFFLHYWMMIFGQSEVALRLPSFIFYLILIASIYFFVKEVFKSKKSAFFAATLTGLNPLIFVYAFEARMYILLMLFSVLSMWFFMTKRWMLYVVVTTVAIYTHNFGDFIILCQIVFYFLNQREFPIRELIRHPFKSNFIKSLSVILLFYLPWIPVLVLQFQRVTSNFWIKQPDLSTIISVFKEFITGHGIYFGSEAIIILTILLLILRGFQKKRDGIFYYWLFLIPAVVFVISKIGESFYLDRYLMVSIPALMILVSTSADNSWLKLWFKKIEKREIKAEYLAAVFMIVILILIGMRDYYRFYRPEKEPFRKLSEYIKRNLEDEEIINFYDERLHYFELRYYGVNTKIYSPIPIPFWDGTANLPKGAVLSKLPNKNRLVVMASENIDNVKLPGYFLSDKVSFNRLYLLWFNKKTK